MQLGQLPWTSVNLGASRRPSVIVNQPSAWTGDLLSTSINSRCSQKAFHQLLSNFHTARRLSMNSVNFPCSQETFRQIFSQLEEHPWNFRAVRRPFGNFREPSMQLGQLPWTSVNLGASRRSSVIVNQPSAWTGDLLSTFVNVPCSRETFRQLLSTFRATSRHSVKFQSSQTIFHPLASTFHASKTKRHFVNFRHLSEQLGEFPSTSVNFLFGQETLRHVPSILHTAGRSSTIFRQLFMRPGHYLSISINFLCSRDTFHQLLSSFHAARRPSFNFLCNWVNFQQLPSTFHSAGRPSVNFPCDWETFHQLPLTLLVDRRLSVNFCQLSAQPGDFLLTLSSFCKAKWPSVIFPLSSMMREIPSTFRAAERLPLTFHAAGISSINFRQLSMQPGDPPSTSVKF